MSPTTLLAIANGWRARLVRRPRITQRCVPRPCCGTDRHLYAGSGLPRDHKGIILNTEVVRSAIELCWISKLATDKFVVLRNADSATEIEIDVGDVIPKDNVERLRRNAASSHVTIFQCRSTTRKVMGPRSSTAAHGAISGNIYAARSEIWPYYQGQICQHRHARNHVGLLHSYCRHACGRAFGCHARCIGQAYGGLVAQHAGAPAWGISVRRLLRSVNRPGVVWPYFVVLDELTYNATSGLDCVRATGRGLNMGFPLAFHERSSMQAFSWGLCLSGSAEVDRVKQAWRTTSMSQDGGITPQLPPMALVAVFLVLGLSFTRVGLEARALSR